MLPKAQFTCITCRVAFKDGEIQRLHYKTDWHRYNLKRKVADLPPVTSEKFDERVLIQRNANEADLQCNIYCNACRKSFCNRNAYDNHLNSKKHKEQQLKSIENDKNKDLNQKSVIESTDSNVTDAEAEEVDSDEWEDFTENPIEENNCLFCPHHSSSFLKNIKHMSVAHSFFIPDVEYCIDMSGLLTLLGEKIYSGFMCLWCNYGGRTFHSADAVVSHMIDKGHCKMLHEGFALTEYARFYDYSSSYPDYDPENADTDSEVEVPELDGSDYQMVLPSGATIGHRSLMRYYKQSIDPNRAVAITKNDKKLHKVLATYRALGWSETNKELEARRKKCLQHMQKLENKYNMMLGVKNNKLQTHFRQQVNF